MQEKADELYFDLSYGASGDMLNAALINLGGDFDNLLKRLALIELKNYRIEYKSETRSMIRGGRFRVIYDRTNHPMRKYSDIIRIIDESDLNNSEKSLSKKIFQRIGEAEASVHGVKLEDVHFHEIGAVDSIVDIVGFSILYNSLNINKCSSSYFHTGTGSTNSMHGEIPVPAPATVEIIKGFPVKGTAIQREILTPTGAAIVATVSEQYGPLPECIIEKTGVGFGSYKDSFNGLRVFKIKRAETLESTETAKNLVGVIETNIDDSTPEEIGRLQEVLFEIGVLDMFVTPVIMKKSRPGYNITVITSPGEIDRVTEAVFKNSSTFGIRYRFMFRKVLERKFREIKLPYGTIKIKIGLYNGEITQISPEYEDCAEISRKTGMPIKDVFFDAVSRAREELNLE